ncbi:hypothetical protein CU669_09455 [Paramagnetospirillum kuznetsovii]|uniref:Uncharacterized protein n=1 Tax=Paramagnetospirillum kuznetsovii TaxID=2053833 RepID=A0A364NZ60_9PROT|nr:hypothetical protein [Paramagnetospirillum kuznetsovii]RAU22333.1 hypothetical protein CU669_09455 [Paramagnetospirillum kuznetsovii]
MKPLAVMLGLVLLVGCNADERGHVVCLEKGVYKGKADTQISDATRTDLRQRIALQSEGPARVATPPGMAVMPSGEAAATGRIAGQKF